VDDLNKQAKRWLKALRARDAEARARFERAYPNGPAAPVLRDVQHAVARERGYENWVALTAAASHERAARDLIAAFNTKDEAALQRLNRYHRRAYTFEDLWAEVWRRVYAFRQRAFTEGRKDLLIEEAQTLLAQDAGFPSWDALAHASATGAPPVPPYEVDTSEHTVSPRRLLSPGEWERLIAEVKERRITAVHANGLMTDAVLARIADLEYVTSLSLGGSRELSDDGLRHLARMPQLQRLDLSEYPGGKLTDRGLEVLRHLPNLRAFEMTWQRGISDAGIAHLRHCDQLERVNLMGSPTGDGAIIALEGKQRLRRFSTGRLVTDAGLPLLHNIPLLKTWSRGEAVGDESPGAFLLVDGPFSDRGLAALAGLEGVGELDLFWHVTGITSPAFANLVNLPNLIALGADGKLSDDTAMTHFAAMPRLQRLRAQATIATDEGFEALSRSRSLERIWTGKDTIQLGDRGFVALSKLSTLQVLGVSCRNVSDGALATLPTFPGLRDLVPIDFSDEGFRHVGGCPRIERLTCMYCRQTGDAATEHIRSLPLRYYYAGLTQITDRSLEILGGMPTLEQIEFYECAHVSDAGLRYLTALPRLRELHVSSSPRVTLAATHVFPDTVRVKYAT
jgi:hypothetical protein